MNRDQNFRQEIIIISGRSGAGKSTAARVLEDMGYFVVDNLPPQLLMDLLKLASNSSEGIEKIAVVIDVRETKFLSLMPGIWQELKVKNIDKRLVFLDASEQKLIERYQETKRRHPLDAGIGLREALELEQKMLEPIKELATQEIYTDGLNAHELRNLIKREIMMLGDYKINLTILSFGFKLGVPTELDLCFDVRFLANPYYRNELRAKTGLDIEVADFVLGQAASGAFLDRVCGLIKFLYPLYREEGKAGLTIAVGCTGGQHRSVAMVEALFRLIKKDFEPIRVWHRDLQPKSTAT